MFWLLLSHSISIQITTLLLNLLINWKWYKPLICRNKHWTLKIILKKVYYLEDLFKQLYLLKIHLIKPKLNFQKLII